MPLPAVKKTWQYAHGSNALSGSQKPDYDATFIIAKNALTAFASSPCTVAGSSNGTTAALDGVDRIVNSAAIVNHAPGGAHSWIVLNLGSGQVLFEWNDVVAILLRISWSPNGLFAGGSTTAAPTASDEKEQQTGQWIGSTTGTGGQYRIHVMRSSDGQNTRVFFCINSLVAGFWCFERAWNPVSGWTLPFCVNVRRITGNITDTGLMTFGVWVGTNAFAAVGPIGDMPLFTTSEWAPGGTGNSIGNRYSIPNELSGEYPICPIGLWHDTTVGQRGRHGSIPDMYFTATTPVMGDTYPADGSKQFQQMGQMIVPSDGTAWLIS